MRLEDRPSSHFIGVDIGGSGIKARVVDVETGALVSERTKRNTPASGDCTAVLDVFSSLIEEADWTGPVGITFPGVVSNDFARTARNLGSGWVGTNLVEVFGNAIGMPVSLLNDADAAMIAEAKFGYASDLTGVSILLTLGTGIGSGVLSDQRLVPNTELGQVMVDGVTAEQLCSSSAKVRDDIGFDEFGRRLNRYLNEVCELMWPDQILIGGGISRDFDQFGHLLDVPAAVAPAALRNEAGIVGAAIAIARRFHPPQIR